MRVRLPANTTGLLYLPAKDVASVMESGKSALQARGVRFLRMEGNRAVFELQSGQYDFTAPWQRE
jgi:alpha-L-rhamnosidase